MDSIAALTKSDIAKPIVVVEKYKKINVPRRVIGKPNEKRLRVGADLVMIPIDKLTINRNTETGSIITVAAKNIEPAAPIPDLIIIPKVGMESIGMNS